MFAALVIQVTQCLHHVMLIMCGLSIIFNIFSHTTRFSRKKLFCLSVELLCETFLILTRIQQDIINIHTSSYKLLFILIESEENFNFLYRFSNEKKNLPDVTKSAQCGPSCSMPKYRVTYMTI